MKIFLSAVSGQFEACRGALRSDLSAVGAEVVVQEDFQQHGASLLEKLERYIASCDRIIALVGDAYGFEPEETARPAGQPRRSYTQWEYFFAMGERLDRSRQPPKDIFLYFASPEFLAMHAISQAGDAAKLQQEFIQALHKSGKDWNRFGSLDELRVLVLRDGFRLPARAQARKLPLGRILLDRLVPAFHRTLTMQYGILSEPDDFPAINTSLRELATILEQEIAGEIYIPPDVKAIASGRKLQSTGKDPFARPIHQHIRHILGSQQGGDFSSAHLSAASRKSKLIRNVLDVLLSSNEPLVLLGDPGTGKTYTLKRAAHALCVKEARRVYPSAVVFIRLGEFSAGDDVDPNQVFQYVMAQCSPALRSWLPSLSKAGRVVIFFDGMDEMSRYAYSAHTKALTRFAGEQHQQGVRSIFSCRITDFSPAFTHHRLVLLPFDGGQIAEYLRSSELVFPMIISGHKWSIRALAHHLAENDTAYDAKTPYILWLLCHYLRNRGEWPRDRVDLLSNSQAENYRWKEAALRPHAVRLDREELFDTWAAFAYCISCRNQGVSIAVVDLEHALQISATFPINAGKVCGVLQESLEESEQHLIRFANQRLQEYYTARYIVRRNPSIVWAEKLDAPQWQETLFNIVLMGGATDALRLLGDSIEDIPKQLRKALRIAGSGKARRDAVPESSSDSSNDGRKERPLEPPSTVSINARALLVEEEALLAERIELGARIVQHTGRQHPAVKEHLAARIDQAIECLGAAGNPISQVKMIHAAHVMPGINMLKALEPALHSPVAWVRKQAIQLLVGYRGKLGVDVATEIAFDIARNRFATIALSYWRAAWKQRRSYSLFVALLGGLCTLAFSAAVLAFLLGSHYSAIEWFTPHNAGDATLSRYIRPPFYYCGLASIAIWLLVSRARDEWQRRRDILVASTVCLTALVTVVVPVLEQRAWPIEFSADFFFGGTFGLWSIRGDKCRHFLVACRLSGSVPATEWTHLRPTQTLGRSDAL